MSDMEATIKAFLAKLGWDVEASTKRVEDVLKNKKLSNTLVYLSKEVRAEFYRMEWSMREAAAVEGLELEKQTLTEFSVLFVACCACGSSKVKMVRRLRPLAL